MAMSWNTSKLHLHREGHIMGKRQKRTSQGDGCRKRSSLKARKRYRGQGKR